MRSDYTRYITRTRDYYRAQGFDRDYQWASNETIPFTALKKPLAKCTVGIVTTAVTDAGIPMSMREAASYNIESVPGKFDTDDLSWDKTTTHTDDRESYFPLESLRSLVKRGTIKALSPHYYFVPTEYSQRNTIEKDAPRTVRACIEDQLDIALLVPL